MNYKVSKLFLLILCLALSACSKPSPQGSLAFRKSIPTPSLRVSEQTIKTDKITRDQELILVERPELFPAIPPMKLRDNSRVRNRLAIYLKKQRPFVTDGLSRRGLYINLIEKIFNEQGLPSELSNVAFLESRFISDAKSSRGATGLWQLMSPTARHLGLTVNRWKDERLDPEKSTIAAARYLKELHERFEDWPLALAAYNAGPTKVSRIIKKCKTRDFYKLFRCGNFRKETQTFVSKFIALTMITRDPEKYGFYLGDINEQ